MATDVSRSPPRSASGGSGSSRRPLVDSYRRLAEVFHLILSEETLDSLLDRIADTLAELVPYDALHVYEADLARRELVPVLVRSEWAKEIMRTRPRLGQGITGWAAAHRRPVLANKAHLDPRVAFIPGTPAEPEALISVPLVARGALKGALSIYRVGEGARFQEDELELAACFGDAAALAIDNAQVRARLEHQAQTDSLTGLYNHRVFHERLRAELTRASRVGDSVAVLMIDVDDFKRVNDIYGHAAGDEMLVALAEALSSLVRTSDIVCRVGGEELAVIMPSCHASDGLGLARRLQEHLDASPLGEGVEITVSIGVAAGPEHAANPRELAACAETAMMTAKARGKSQIVVFGEDAGERPGEADPARDVRSLAYLKLLQSLVNKLSRLCGVEEIGQAVCGRAAQPHRLPRLWGRRRRLGGAGGGRGRPGCRRGGALPPADQSGRGGAGAGGSHRAPCARGRCVRARPSGGDPRHGSRGGVGHRRPSPLQLPGQRRCARVQAGRGPARRPRPPPHRGLGRVCLGGCGERAPVRGGATGGGERQGLARVPGRPVGGDVGGGAPGGGGEGGSPAGRRPAGIPVAGGWAEPELPTAGLDGGGRGGASPSCAEAGGGSPPGRPRLSLLARRGRAAAAPRPPSGQAGGGGPAGL